MEPQLLYHRVPGSDFPAKYAVAFLIYLAPSSLVLTPFRLVQLSFKASSSLFGPCQSLPLPFLVRLTPIPG